MFGIPFLIGNDRPVSGQISSPSITNTFYDIKVIINIIVFILNDIEEKLL